MATIVPTLIDGDDFTQDFTLKVRDAVTELQTIASAGSTGVDNVGPTSGTDELIVKSLTVPATGEAGRVHVWGQFAGTTSNNNERFDSRLVLDGTSTFAQGRGQRDPGLENSPTWTVTGSFSTTGASSHTVEFRIKRVGGTGTATVSNTTFSGMHWIFVPAPA